MIRIEIAFADDQQQLIMPLTLDAPCTVEEAILCSGILKKVPHIDLAKNKVGIFGKLNSLTCTINDGDRIEIYRPLSVDAKQARRLRVKRRNAPHK